MAERRAEPLRLGSIAPNFQAETTQGNIDFHGPSLSAFWYSGAWRVKLTGE